MNLYSKNGFFTVEAKVFIDASADADLSTNAGVLSQYGRESDNLAQPMTMNIKVNNVDREKMIQYIQANKHDMLDTIPFSQLSQIPRTGMQGGYTAICIAKENGTFSIDRDMVLCFETNNKGEFILNMSRIIKKSAVKPFDLTYASIEGRRQAHEIVTFMKDNIPGFENRMFENAVAMGGYPIDVHSPDGASMKHRFLKPESWYSIPYNIIVTNEIDNLIVAGRCISATHEACAAIRVTPILMAIAQAAGTAAAQSVANNEKVNNLNVSKLQQTLKNQKVFLEKYQG